MTGWDAGTSRCHTERHRRAPLDAPGRASGGVTAIGVAVGQHFFVTGGVKGEVRVWDARSRRLISTLKEHCQAVVGVECLGDDVHVVSASRDRSIITWDLVHERRVAATHAAGRGASTPSGLHRADGRDATRMVSVGQDRSLVVLGPHGGPRVTGCARRARATLSARARRSRRWASSPRARRTRREAVGLRDGHSAGGGARALRSRAGGGVFARRIDARQRGGRRDRHGVGRARGGATETGWSMATRRFFVSIFFFFCE